MEVLLGLGLMAALWGGLVYYMGLEGNDNWASRTVYEAIHNEPLSDYHIRQELEREARKAEMREAQSADSDEEPKPSG